jgi:hypothetical protein
MESAISHGFSFLLLHGLLCIGAIKGQAYADSLEAVTSYLRGLTWANQQAPQSLRVEVRLDSRAQLHGHIVQLRRENQMRRPAGFHGSR